MPKISQRLIYRMPYQRRTKWNSQFTQEQVTIFIIVSKECRIAEPSHVIPYQCSAFFISKATCPGMPEFAKSEFSVIRLHEVKIMRKIRKQEWAKFFSERGWKTSQMHCLCPGLHLVTWCDTRKSTICRLHHPTKGKDGIYTEWFIDVFIETERTVNETCQAGMLSL